MRCTGQGDTKQGIGFLHPPPGGREREHAAGTSQVPSAPQRGSHLLQMTGEGFYSEHHVLLWESPAAPADFQSISEELSRDLRTAGAVVPSSFSSNLLPTEVCCLLSHQVMDGISSICSSTWCTSQFNQTLPPNINGINRLLDYEALQEVIQPVSLI